MWPTSGAVVSESVDNYAISQGHQVHELTELSKLACTPSDLTTSSQC